MVYDMIYDMIWYDMICYDTIYMWCVMCDMILYMIRYVTVRYDTVRYDIWYDIYDKIYMMRYIWYDIYDIYDVWYDVRCAICDIWYVMWCDLWCDISTHKWKADAWMRFVQVNLRFIYDFYVYVFQANRFRHPTPKIVKLLLILCRI